MKAWRLFLWENLRDKILPAGLGFLESVESFFFPFLPPPAPKGKRGDGVSLVIYHGMGGGADAQAQADAAACRRRGKKIIFLSFEVLRRRFVLSADGAEAEHVYPWAFARLWRRLDEMNVSEIRLHHLRYWPWEMAAALPRYIKEREISLSVFLHDFTYFCPRIHLLDGTYRYCRQPDDPAVCDACLRKSGPLVRKKGSALFYRTAQKEILSLAKEIIAPSQDTAARYLKIWPDLKVAVSPETWGDAALAPYGMFPEKAHIAIVGNIGRQKGADILLRLARFAKETGEKLPLTVIGDCVYAQELRSLGVFVTGSYARADLPGLLAAHEITGVWFSSPWPETYSFVFNEVWKCGLPVAAFDLGAPAERIRQRAGGRDKILSLSAIDDMDALYRALMSFAEGR